MSRLVQELESDESLYVGEIGVDKAYRNRDTNRNEFEAMRELFEEQFRIACKLRRPVVIHNVRAHGYMMDFLQGKKVDELPPKIYFHAFCGSSETAKQLLCMESLQDRIYFGFSRSVNMRNEEKLKSLLNIIPLSKLLLESDAEDVHRVEYDLDTLEAFCSTCTGLSTAEIQLCTSQNALNLFDTRI